MDGLEDVLLYALIRVRDSNSRPFPSLALRIEGI